MSLTGNDIDALRRRVLYRATHRGTKEMDWILGRFAKAEVGAMDREQLHAFERFLALPDPDIECWTMDRRAERPDGEAGAIVDRLRRFHGVED